MSNEVRRERDEAWDEAEWYAGWAKALLTTPMEPVSGWSPGEARMAALSVSLAIEGMLLASQFM